MSTISKFLPLPPNNFSTQIATTNLGTTDLSVDLDSTTGLGTEGVGQFFKKDANGEVIAGSIEFVHWTGKSGNTLTFTDTGDRGISGSDSGAQAYVADDWFEVWVSSYYQPTDGILVEHEADGTHDSALVAMLAGTQSFTGEKTFEDKITINDERVETIYDNGNSGTSKTINWTNGASQKITLTGDCILSFSNATAGGFLTLFIDVNATGGYTLTLPSDCIGVSGTTITKTANAKNSVGFRYDGSKYRVFVNPNEVALTSL